VQSIDLREKKEDGLRLRLRAAGRKSALLEALRGLECVISVEGAECPEDGAAEFVLVCRPGDGQGKATDQVFRLLAGMNAPIRMMREEQDTLEEIFLRNT